MHISKVITSDQLKPQGVINASLNEQELFRHSYTEIFEIQDKAYLFVLSHNIPQTKKMHVHTPVQDRKIKNLGR